ncbi:hypothetical protein DKP76_11565 [Falsochrobactrum shanghaiense]|uniref:Uncharacterized protein n=1 Tax=Falsochrobactrum shanghaiense TaxID=2201899 RepID=A0A316J9G6_9HYPH|nr:hypothetical protein [Falsochrobactrum shanghaiense]PWL17409.1 hypothetical protein DKP76_11565 [Falsochrobactrum shanghaiense]
MKFETILIEEYLSKHGVRRFEQGESTDFHHLASFLSEYGYTVSGSPMGMVNVSQGRGRPRRMGMAKLIAIADEIRVAQGLEPFNAASKQAA